MLQNFRHWLKATQSDTYIKLEAWAPNQIGIPTNISPQLQRVGFEDISNDPGSKASARFGDPVDPNNPWWNWFIDWFDYNYNNIGGWNTVASFQNDPNVKQITDMIRGSLMPLEKTDNGTRNAVNLAKQLVNAIQKASGRSTAGGIQNQSAKPTTAKPNLGATGPYLANTWVGGKPPQ